MANGTNKKRCNKCSTEKELAEFHRDNSKKDGRATVCIACSKQTSKRYRENNVAKIKEKQRKWYVENKERKRAYRNEYVKEGHGLWLDFFSRMDNVKIDEGSFLRWYSKQSKRCFYCGCTIDEVSKYMSKMNIQRVSKRLELDKRNPRLGYLLGNIVLACHVCNNHKKDFFTEKQFVAIAKRYIRSKILDS